MKHARPDYDRIQDPDHKIPQDEPVFLLRAQDKHFVSILNEYAREVTKDGGDVNIIRAVHEHITRARLWRRQHGVKAPDMPGPEIKRPQIGRPARWPHED